MLATDDYSTSVIPMIKLTAIQNSSGEAFCGRIYCFRANFASSSPQSDMMECIIGDSYIHNYMMRGDFVQKYDINDVLTITPCTFTYNGQKYGGFEVKVVSTGCRLQIDGYLTYFSNQFSQIQMIKYESHQSGSTIVNQEIKDSIDYTKVVFSADGLPEIEYNGHKVMFRQESLADYVDLATLGYSATKKLDLNLIDDSNFFDYSKDHGCIYWPYAQRTFVTNLPASLTSAPVESDNGNACLFFMIGFKQILIDYAYRFIWIRNNEGDTHSSWFCIYDRAECIVTPTTNETYESLFNRLWALYDPARSSYTMVLHNQNGATYQLDNINSASVIFRRTEFNISTGAVTIYTAVIRASNSKYVKVVGAVTGSTNWTLTDMSATAATANVNWAIRYNR